MNRMDINLWFTLSFCAYLVDVSLSSGHRMLLQTKLGLIRIFLLISDLISLPEFPVNSFYLFIVLSHDPFINVEVNFLLRKSCKSSTNSHTRFM